MAPICTICRFKMVSLITKTTCGHLFHTDCLIQWFEEKSPEKPCPVCRQEIHQEQRCSAPISPSIIKQLDTQLLTIFSENTLGRMETKYQARKDQLESDGMEIRKRLLDNTVACHTNDRLLKAIRQELKTRSEKTGNKRRPAMNDSTG